MSTPPTTGTRTAAIMRSHQVAAQLGRCNNACYAILIALTKGSIDTSTLAADTHMQKSSAYCVLRTLAKQNVFTAKEVIQGKIRTIAYTLTPDGLNLAKQLLS